MATAERQPTTALEPFYDNVRAHYDLSNEFYALFLDPTMTYSSAWYEREDMTLEQAQQAKIDMSLRKTGIQPGQRLLEIGFGWGYTMRRAAENFGANVVGLTLSLEQHKHVTQAIQQQPPSRGSVEVRLQGWEQFHEPVDAIISLEVFEHFRRERYPAFFERCRQVLPAGGRMLLQTNLWNGWRTLEAQGIPLEHEHILFGKFIRKYIFPGGELCEPSEAIREAELAGFNVPETVSLKDHYIRTLDQWAENLSAQRDRAIELTSEEIYDRYMHYITGSSKMFRSGHIDVMQFTMVAR